MKSQPSIASYSINLLLREAFLRSPEFHGTVTHTVNFRLTWPQSETLSQINKYSTKLLSLDQKWPKDYCYSVKYCWDWFLRHLQFFFQYWKSTPPPLLNTYTIYSFLLPRSLCLNSDLVDFSDSLNLQAITRGGGTEGVGARTTWKESKVFTSQCSLK